MTRYCPHCYRKFSQKYLESDRERNFRVSVIGHGSDESCLFIKARSLSAAAQQGVFQSGADRKNDHVFMAHVRRDDCWTVKTFEVQLCDMMLGLVSEVSR